MTTLRHSVGTTMWHNCAACGEDRLGQHDILVCGPGGHRWSVCPDCVGQGPNSLAEQLLVRASGLMDEATALLRAAHELRTQPPYWPTRQQLAATMPRPSEWGDVEF